MKYKAPEHIRFCGECMYWTPTGAMGGDTPLDMEHLGACPWYNACRRESDFCSSGKPKGSGASTEK